MERTKLKEARRAKGTAERRRLTQQDVADAIGCSVEIYSMWERGECLPQDHYLWKLVKYYGVTDPQELDLVPRALILTLEEIIAMLERYGRRELIALLQQLSIFAGVDLVAFLDSQKIAPEDFLHQCRAIIDECWGLLDHNGNAIADRLITECMRTLPSLATDPSYRRRAASFAVEARIIQIIIASRRLDYASRDLLALDAVRFGKLSGDANMHTIALSWHGDTYHDCYCQPETAIAIFENALPSIDDVSLLNKVDISMGLATAYAQWQNEKKAQDYIALARMTMPEYPELDPVYGKLIGFGEPELVLREGNIYLILAEHFPDGEYASKAHEAFEKSMSKEALGTGYRGRALILKADAARALGDMDELVKCLTKGFHISVELGNLKRLSEAQEVLSRVPPEWKRETAICDLKKDLSQAIIEARR